MTLRGTFLQADVTLLRQLEDGPVWVLVSQWRPFLSTLRTRLDALVLADMLSQTYVDALGDALDAEEWINAAAFRTVFLLIRQRIEALVLPPLDDLLAGDPPTLESKTL